MNIKNTFKPKRKLTALILSLIILLSFSSCLGTDKNTSEYVNYEDGILYVDFIDVGQGDSIFIKSEDESMLIDAGENDQGDTVVDHIKSTGTDELKYAVSTHAHSDHCGGLDTVLKNIRTKSLICTGEDDNTKTWKDVLKAAKKNHVKTEQPNLNKEYTLGSATFTVLAPQPDSIYSRFNNYSIVIKLKYGEKTFLFMGDAENVSENEILSHGYDVHADVLKLGHHGSKTSTSADFLRKVNPKYAVISCGKNNDYGHPHKGTLKKLEYTNTEVHRTDLEGTIRMQTDGHKITVNNVTSDITTDTQSSERATEKEVIPQTTLAPGDNFVGNKNSRKLHLPDCDSVEAMHPENKVFFNHKEDAFAEGYEPCKNCEP